MAGVATFIGVWAGAEGIRVCAAVGDLGAGGAGGGVGVDFPLIRAEVEGGLGLTGVPLRLGKTAMKEIFLTTDHSD
jgi:hypothetical protein